MPWGWGMVTDVHIDGCFQQLPASEVGTSVTRVPGQRPSWRQWLLQKGGRVHSTVRQQQQESEQDPPLTPTSSADTS